jgi:ubiquinone/menaquinone biosynthesis C-methylase UbiE
MQPADPRVLPKILQIFFKYLYNQFAWSYDLVAWFVSVGQWKGWVATAVPFLSGGRVLELGHGPGHLQLMGAEAGKSIVGLDLSIQMGKICRRRMEKHQVDPRLVRGDGIALPFESLSFETIVATFPAEYIVFPQTLTQIFRCLTPDGTFVLLPLAWVTGPGLFHKFTAWLFRITGQSIPLDHPALDQGFNRIKNAGFAVETMTVPKKNSRVLIVLARKPPQE